MSNIQYTIRGIPTTVDIALRKQARRSGKSFNATVVEALEQATFVNVAGDKSQDFFEKFNGSNTLDDKFYEALEIQSQIDEELWK